MPEMLTIALSKGRILEQTLPLLRPLGIEPMEDPARSRNLVLPTTDPSVRLIIVRATDVPTYVAHGGADIGVAGKDVLLEQGGHGLYEPIDLGIARCRLMVAGRPDTRLEGRRVRVATKFVNITRRHFAAKGRQVDLIKLYGSMELAPLMGLLSVLMGIGGGSFGVPVMTLYGRPVHRAVATAAGFGAIIAVPAVLGFLLVDMAVAPPLSLGAVNLAAFALVIAMTLITAPWGAALAHRLDPKPLKRVFGAFLMVVALNMLLQGL